MWNGQSSVLERCGDRGGVLEQVHPDRLVVGDHEAHGDGSVEGRSGRSGDMVEGGEDGSFRAVDHHRDDRDDAPAWGERCPELPEVWRDLVRTRSCPDPSGDCLVAGYLSVDLVGEQSGECGRVLFGEVA